MLWLLNFELCFLAVCEDHEEYSEEEAEQQDLITRYFAGIFETIFLGAEVECLAETDLNEHLKDFLKWCLLNWICQKVDGEEL
ncbi:hypothetical protein MKX03_028556 [Papaver bracteatum]|nr:hypothetical protein MKX03_028556 [Papaver bracteatum]